jgi:hypothetical protein
MPNIFQPSLSNTPTYQSTTGTAAITPYATDLLQRGQAFATAETPVYEGQLTTGPSELQNQAFQGLANLTIPTNITEAGNQLGNIASQQQNLSYTPGTITNTYNPAAGNYKPINVTNQYTAAGGSYKPIDVTTGTFGNEEAQKYMNPYIQQALDPQLEYMRRQAAINQQGDMAKLAQAGAFGGSRQAILQGQNQEALMRQQAATTGAGYQQAFSQAQQQFNADQARQLQATQSNIQQAQKAADLNMTDAQMTAQYGMQATQSNIQQAQKAADLGMTDAHMMAQFGMDAQKANELSRQFAATYKANALQSAAQSQQARGALGGMEAQYGLANLNALSAAGATQHEQEQAALDAQYKEFLRQTAYPGQQLVQQQGLISAMAPLLPKTETIYGQKQAAAQTAAGAIGFAKDLLSGLGINSYSDLKKAAAAAGKSITDFARSIGVKESDLPQELGKEGQPAIIGERGTGLEEPPITEPDDTGGGNYSPNDPDFYVPTVDEDSTIGYGEDQYSGAAKGGLVDLLHKMRSYK